MAWSWASIGREKAPRPIDKIIASGPNAAPVHSLLLAWLGGLFPVIVPADIAMHISYALLLAQAAQLDHTRISDFPIISPRLTSRRVCCLLF